MIFPLLLTIVFAAPLLVACYTDYTEMKIPNWVSLAMIAGFFLTLPITWTGLSGLGDHLLLFFIFFALGFATFAFGWLGGGDAKLMAAIALWLDTGVIMDFVLFTALTGAALGLFIMISRRFMPVSIMTAPVVSKLYQGGKDMPYALALAAGALLVWPNTQIFLAA